MFLLRGGGDTEEKLLRQASLLESRYTYGGSPARGISLFAVDVLPGTVDDYLEAAARATAASF